MLSCATGRYLRSVNLLELIACLLLRRDLPQLGRRGSAPSVFFAEFAVSLDDYFLVDV